MNSKKIAEIIQAKADAGENAYLWLQSECGDCGDCFLWENEEESFGDNGSNALERWSLTAQEIEKLTYLGIVDEYN